MFLVRRGRRCLKSGSARVITITSIIMFITITTEVQMSPRCVVNLVVMVCKFVQACPLVCTQKPPHPHWACIRLAVICVLHDIHMYMYRVYMYISLALSTYIYIYIYVYYMFIYIYIYIYMFICVYIYIYVYTYLSLYICIFQRPIGPRASKRTPPGAEERS